jgi:hypothetical protein
MLPDVVSLVFSYMRGRLTLEKINAAVDEMVTYAEANTRLLGAPRKKVISSQITKEYKIGKDRMTSYAFMRRRILNKQTV